MWKVTEETGNRYGRLIVLSRDETNSYGAVRWKCQCDCGNITVVLGTSLRKGDTKSCGCLKHDGGGAINETGHRYGNLTVLHKVITKGAPHALWFCKCDCGGEKIVTGGNLRNGNTSSCGCRYVVNEIGNRYGRLVVVSKAENSKGGYVQWNCVCDCGNKKTVPGNDLRRGGTKSCGCLLKLGYSEATFNKVFKQIKRQAKVRGYFWDLTRKDIKDITKQDCCYCGVSPKQRCKSNHNNGDYVYNGIDRVDNSKGYTIDNIVPCCFQCNAAKRAYTSEDFFAWVERVYNHSIGDKK